MACPRILGEVCTKHPELNGLRFVPAGRPKGRCIACNSESGRRHYEKNKEQIRSKHRDYAKANADTMNERSRTWAKKNRERHLANDRAWRQANPGRARSYAAAWAKANPDKCAVISARRRAAQQQATPVWANDFFIAEAYHLAALRKRICGGEWHVDHIVPITSKKVCGLHVEHNLQVIPGGANSSKGNRHWPDMPGAA